MKRIITIFLVGLVSNVFAQTAQFTANNTSICEDLSVQFTDQSTGTITSWFWDFGDGGTSTDQNPAYTYLNPGTYTVSLTVNLGADVEVKSNYITVQNAADINVSPSLSSACTIPQTVTFNNTTSGAGINYTWSFGDGNTSTQQSPSNTYVSYGTFNATITANNGTCTSTQTYPIELQNFQADFVAVPNPICLGDTTNFTDISSHPTSLVTWNFGDGNTSIVASPSHVYAGNGAFTVSLIAISQAGCLDTTVKSGYMIVNALPVISFTSDDDTACQAPFNVNFTNTTPGLVSFDWNFGDGANATSANPSHTYTALGNYPVSLQGIDANGCTSSTSVSNYIVIVAPSAAIASDVWNGCEDLVVNFLDASTCVEPITAWDWDLGPAGSSAIENPSNITYPDTGSFPIELIITSQNGCKDTMQYLIEVGMPPVVNMTVDNTIGCHPFTVNFTDLSSTYADQWLWDFHDGNTSTAQNPSNTFTLDTGYFDITLTASMHGCPSTLTFNDAIYVKQAKPIFTVDSLIDCFGPYTIQFTDSSRGAEDFTWKFGDGNTQYFGVGTTNASTSHTYALPGTYVAWLVVQNYTQNCMDSISTTIRISDLEPGFMVDTTATCTPNAILFTDTSEGTFLPHTYAWVMSDGYTQNNASFSYNFAGVSDVYDVTLSVTDALGCTKTLSYSSLIDVKPLPVVGFMEDTTLGCAPLMVNFQDTSSSVVPLQSWSWNFGDGSALDPTQNPTHSFNSAGTYAVALTVTDNNNCSNTMTKSNLITTTFPAPSFTIPLFACNYSFVDPTNTSAGANLSYVWNFGDGSNLDSTMSPSHTYMNITGNGTVEITLIATDSNGCVDSVKQNLLISVPTADFTQDTTFSDCPPLTVNFTELASSNVSAFDWNFGDGSTAVGAFPTHTYTSAGIYHVTLMVIDDYGCRDTLQKDSLIFVGGITGTAYVAVDTNACGQTFIFTSTAGSDVDYQWNFGDGSTSASVNPVHTYASVGNYNPVVQMTDSNGCVLTLDLDTITATSEEAFTVALTPSTTSAGIGNAVLFSATTTESVAMWYWNFGDSTFVDTTVGALSHSYSTEGVYTVNVSGMTADGCSGTGTVEITIYDNTDLVGNTFTPNGDGWNDVYTIYNNGALTHELSIYNRWGHLIFHGLAPLVEWYGKDFAGSDVPEGTYYYILQSTMPGNSLVEKTGYITVIR